MKLLFAPGGVFEVLVLLLNASASPDEDTVRSSGPPDASFRVPLACLTFFLAGIIQEGDTRQCT